MPTNNGNDGSKNGKTEQPSFGSELWGEYKKLHNGVGQLIRKTEGIDPDMLYCTADRIGEMAMKITTVADDGVHSYLVGVNLWQNIVLAQDTNDLAAMTRLENPQDMLKILHHLNEWVSWQQAQLIQKPQTA